VGYRSFGGVRGLKAFVNIHPKERLKVKYLR